MMFTLTRLYLDAKLKQAYLFFLLVASVNLIMAQNDLSNLKKGVYLTYGDFYNNTIVLVDSIVIDTIKRTHKNWDTTFDFRVNRLSDNKKVSGAWGFSDGKNAFIFYQKEAWKLNFQNMKYSFVAYGLPKPRKTKFIGYMDPSTGNYAGGGVEEIYYFFDDRKQIKTPSDYIIDINNGRVKHDDYGYVNGTGITNSKIHFYRSEKGEVPDSVYLRVGDSLSYVFVPNSYYSLNLAVTPKPLQICILNESDCFTLDLTSKEEWFFKVSSQADKATINEVPLSEGSFYSFKAEKKQKKRRKKEKKKK